MKKITLIINIFLMVAILIACQNETTADTTRDLEVWLEQPDSYATMDYGMAGYLDLDRLAFVDSSSHSYGVSSAGTDGSNSDGFNGQNWLYIDDDGDHVIFDAKGQGIINKIWTTGTYNETAIVKIYIDGDSEPTWEGSYYTFTKGNTEPFGYPLTKYWSSSAGGRITYLPIGFSQSCKISIDNPGTTNLFWYIDYYMLDGTAAVESFTGSVDTPPVYRIWNAAGNDFKKSTGVVKKTATVDLENGDNEIFLLSGSRQIQSIHVAIPGLMLPDTSGNADTNRTSENYRDILNNIRLKIFWDGETSPSVNASLATFFGMGSFGYNNDVKSLFFGVDDGILYNYYPMPFQSSAMIVLMNESGETINGVTVEIRDKPVDFNFYNVGYFSTCEKDIYVYKDDPFEVVLLDIEGSGKIVGIQLNEWGDTNRDVYFEEGDIRVYIDGARTPQISSPGTEDFFNGAGYFLNTTSQAKKGLYTTQLSGYTNWYVHDDSEAISVYRAFANDAITFRDGIQFSIEHGGGVSGSSDRYSSNESVGYVSLISYYHIPVRKIVSSDEIIFADSESMNLHEATISGESSLLMNTSAFYGTFFNFKKGYQSLRIQGSITFELSINENNYGAVLNRFYDSSTLNTCARVYVDDVFAGEWYTAGKNNTYTIAEDQFVIPPALVQGKSSITITINNDSINDWNIISCELKSYVDLPAESNFLENGGTYMITTDNGKPTLNGSNDIRILRFDDTSYVLVHSLSGKILFDDNHSHLRAELYISGDLGENHLWSIEKSGSGYLIKNIGTEYYLVVQNGEYELGNVSEEWHFTLVAKRNNLNY